MSTAALTRGFFSCFFFLFSLSKKVRGTRESTRWFERSKKLFAFGVVVVVVVVVVRCTL